MKIKIVGVVSQDYKLENGYSFKGSKVHALDLGTENQFLTGNLTTTLRIPAESQFSSDLVVGEIYNVFFDQKGNVDFMQRVKS